ncbi:MAG: sensor domain-containing diguanylate cyclase [Treponema sp.]|nr:sensor domain-containing diguanylate cyclase [Treponema sp.]
MDQVELLGELSTINNELITARRELSRISVELKEEKQFAERVLALSPDIVYVYDLDRRAIEFENRRIEEVLGYEKDEFDATGGDVKEPIVHPEDLAALREHNARVEAARDGATFVVEYRAKSASGAWRWIRARESVFARAPDGSPRSKLGIAQDVTAEKEREELLRQLSLVDELTGLGNRRSFDLLAAQQLKMISRGRKDATLVYLDLDDFKSINDNYGHAEGDRALREAADMLRENFRSSDILARVGGDEFAVLIADGDEALAASLVARLMAAAARGNARRARPYDIVFSAGMASCRDTEPCELARLLSSADSKMYQAKRARRKP